VDLNSQLVQRDTWNGEPEFALSFPHSESKLLYLVKFRHETNTPVDSHDALTPAEIAAGVTTFEPSSKILKHLSGHDTGQLHSISAEAVLTWTLEPRDEVLHVFEVRFSGTRTLVWQPSYSETEPYSYETDWREAKCDPVIHGVLVSLDSTPGRSAMLGEDTLDEAFGNDNLRRQLEAALEGDWRKCLCAVRYTPDPEAPSEVSWPPAKPWHETWHGSQEITVERSAKAN
jgi:hypothetical protein